MYQVFQIRKHKPWCMHTQKDALSEAEFAIMSVLKMLASEQAP